MFSPFRLQPGSLLSSSWPPGSGEGACQLWLWANWPWSAPKAHFERQISGWVKASFLCQGGKAGKTSGYCIPSPTCLKVSHNYTRRAGLWGFLELWGRTEFQESTRAGKQEDLGATMLYVQLNLPAGDPLTDSFITVSLDLHHLYLYFCLSINGSISSITGRECTLGGPE